MCRNFPMDQYVYTYIVYAMTYDTRSCDLYILKYATMYVESLAVYSVYQRNKRILTFDFDFDFAF